jgi:hypothetical protein
LGNELVRKLPVYLYKKEEVTGEWRRLLKEELHDLSFSPSAYG